MYYHMGLAWRLQSHPCRLAHCSNCVGQVCTVNFCSSWGTVSKASKHSPIQLVRPLPAASKLHQGKHNQAPSIVMVSKNVMASLSGLVLLAFPSLVKICKRAKGQQVRHRDTRTYQPTPCTQVQTASACTLGRPALKELGHHDAAVPYGACKAFSNKAPLLQAQSFVLSIRQLQLVLVRPVKPVSAPSGVKS